MARKRTRKNSKRIKALYLVLGMAIGWFTPDLFWSVRNTIGNWVGQIVVYAVHQHWNWEQQQLFFQPATSQKM